MMSAELFHPLLMPALCLALLALIMAQGVFPTLTGINGHVAAPELFWAPSIPDAEFLPSSCFNMSHLPYVPENPSFGHWAPHGVPGFVFVSAHRLTAYSFAVLGIAPVATQNVWGRYGEACLWVSFSGPSAIAGSLAVYFANSSYSVKEGYDITTIHCTLSNPTPADEGGSLFVNIQGVDELLVYREGPGPVFITPPTPLPSSLTMCSTLLLPQEMGSLALVHVKEHLQFMRFMGVDGFVLYDAGALTPELGVTLVPFAQEGLVEFVNMHGALNYMEVGDALAANDCAFRMRLKAAWVIRLAFDEYPSLEDPSKQLPHLLQKHSGAAWLSLGTVIWYTEMCYNEHMDELWATERMTWRAFEPTCSLKGVDKALCPGDAGRRRLIFDPRKVGVILPHRIVLPTDGGVELKTDTARINKYLGFFEPGTLECEWPVEDGHDDKKGRGIPPCEKLSKVPEKHPEERRHDPIKDAREATGTSA